MRQRVMIAMALACKPALLIADEPTTALDVTIQAQILRLLADLQAELGIAMVLITHDLGVVARIARQVAVMYAGQIVEEGPVESIFATPRHPYTQGLIACLPELDREPDDIRPDLPEIPGVVPSPHVPALLSVRNLAVHFPVGGKGADGKPGVVKAVDGVSFDLARGRTLAIVGESGSGKTTTALSVLRLADPTAGSIHFDGTDLTALGGASLRQMRRRLQLVFQDPYSSLNPRQRAEDIVRAPLDLMRSDPPGGREARVATIFPVGNGSA
ncbi:hypothetical protein G6F63_013288 [Rhizopus arrhizus]|nr:hypothetical protein G6F63_013288 [Rhizopus arrhizus]